MGAVPLRQDTNRLADQFFPAKAVLIGHHLIAVDDDRFRSRELRNDEKRRSRVKSVIAKRQLLAKRSCRRAVDRRGLEFPMRPSLRLAPRALLSVRPFARGHRGVRAIRGRPPGHRGLIPHAGIVLAGSYRHRLITGAGIQRNYEVQCPATLGPEQSVGTQSFTVLRFSSGVSTHSEPVSIQKDRVQEGRCNRNGKERTASVPLY